MTSSRRQFVQGSAAGLTLGGFTMRRGEARQALEASKIVVGFAPGGTLDLTARRVAEKLQSSYAKGVIVENKMGAAGQIAVTTVKNAPSDGTTILITPASPLSLHRYTYKRLPYDPVNDVIPVSGAAMFDYALAIGPMVPGNVGTVTDFLDWCRAAPGKASFGTAGEGSAAHFIGAALGRAGRAELQHVGYRGSQPAILDVIGGQIAAMMGPTGELISNVKAGKCRLLATSGAERGKFTPDTPTLAEQGFKTLSYLGWFGVYLPARTPPDVVERLNGSISSALDAPDVTESLASVYLEPMPTSAARLGEILETDATFWGALVKSAGYTPEG